MILALSGFWLVIVAIIAFVFILGLIIVIHEGGHFIFARRAGILCHEFSIGMGPVLYKKKFTETTFCIRAIPIGGFVSMAGEEVSSELIKVGDEIGLNINNDDKVTEIVCNDKIEAKIRGKVKEVDLYGENGETLHVVLTLEDGSERYYEVLRNARYIFNEKQSLQITPYDRSFESKSLLDRFLTIFAGPFMNFVLAIFIYLIVSFGMGVPNMESNVIGEITSGYPADTVLQAGDAITSVDGQKVESWEEFSKVLDSRYEEYDTTLDIEYVRDGKTYNTTLDLYVIINSIGISNIGVTQDKLEVSGVRVGNLGLRYKDGTKDSIYDIQKGDILTKIQVGAETPIQLTSWSQLASILDGVDNNIVTFEYYSVKKGGIVSLSECRIIEPWNNETLDNQRIEKIGFKLGVSPEYHVSFLGCIAQAGQLFWDDFTLIFRTLQLLIAPSIRQVGLGDLSGPVGIFDMVRSYVNAGFIPLLAFAGLLSVNIGVMNLLPIPALDGGRLVFLLYELITRKKPSKKVENTINNVFFILLMLLFVYITFNDVFRMIG